MTSYNPTKIVEILQIYEVQFVIIGGYAVNYHGYVRATEDLDIIFLRDSDGETNLLRALESINAYWITDVIDAATGLEKTVPVDSSFISSNRLMMVGSDIGFLDIFDYIPGFPKKHVSEVFDDCDTIDGINIVSLTWLKKIKRASNRPRDIEDLENLP